MTFQTCDLSPFVAKVVAQKGSLEDAASALQIFIRQLEGYLRQLKNAVCADLGSSGGVKNFIELLDVPNTYFGSANKLVRVNSFADGLEFFTSPYATAFLDLIDVPHSYAGASLKGVRVNVGETGLEFYLRSLIGLSDFPASYTSQALKFLRVNAAATAVEFVVAALTLLSDFPASYSGAALKVLRVNAGANAVEFHTEAFTDLSDVPASYSGAASKIVAVNAAGNGLEFLATTASDLTFVLTPSIKFAIFAGGGWGTGTGVSGFGASFAANTITNPALATTNLLTSTYRAVATGSAVAGNSASIRCNEAIVLRGNAAGIGGFRVRARFASETALAQQRGFVGLCATIGATIPNGQPSAFVNICGFSYDSAATNWSTITNDNAGGAVTSSLGSGYPVDATTVYEITLIAQPNASTIDWTIANLSSGASTSGTFSGTDLPVNTTFLTFQLWINNGTTGTAAKATIFSAVVALY